MIFLMAKKMDTIPAIKNGALESDLEYNKGKLSGSCSWYYLAGT